MQRQVDSDKTTLEMVAEEQRRNIVRDRIVGAFLALGLLIGATTIESMAHSANRAPVAQAQVQAPVMLASALVVNIEQVAQ